MINIDKKSQHVKAGDAITADLINSIINSVPKLHNPSNTLGFRETEDGVLLHQNNIIAAGGGGSAAKSVLRPWKIRWMPTSKTDENAGQWQIYMPIGCGLFNKDVCYPKNGLGNDADNSPTIDWYRLEDPQDKDADIQQIGKYQYKTWTVYVHFKPYPLMYASTIKDDDAFKGTKADLAVGTIGVKTWTDDGGVVQTSRTTQQMYFEPFSHEMTDSGTFQLMYVQEGGDKTSEDSYKLYLVNQYVQFGRHQVWIEQKTSLANYENVVVKIDHSGKDPSISIVDVKEADSSDYTYVKILELKDGIVVFDDRDAIRNPLPLYNN